MNILRLSAFGAAIVVGGVAVYMMVQKPEEVPAQSEQIETSDVLVAAADIPIGTLFAADKLRWQAWPTASVSDGMITKWSSRNAIEDLAGAASRANFVKGEPIRQDKVVRRGAGFMAAILPSGKRALAINIDGRGANSAGGFVFPNDKVDVVRTLSLDGSAAQGGANVESETILRNVRVLAIGQNIEEKNGEKVVVGETATLELDPRQVEVVILAQRQGPLSLALRSLSDAETPEDDSTPGANKMSVIRNGIVSQR